MNLKYFINLAVCVVGFLTPQLTHAQGVVTYLDNTSPPIAGSYSVGRPIGILFQTGTNSTGYMLNNFQLLFADAMGNPDPVGLEILLVTDPSYGPGDLISLLIPNKNPTMTGLYTCSPASTVFLANNTSYWLLVLATNGSLNDAYELSYAETAAPTSSDGWLIPDNPVSLNLPIFAINATPVPEPSSIALLAVGGLAVLLVLRSRRPHGRENYPLSP